MESENDQLVAPWILLCDERAKRIAQLEAKLARAMEALKKFADLAGESGMTDSGLIDRYCFEARQALKELTDEAAR